MNEYLTQDEVAQLLRTSPQTLRHWRYRGVGPRWWRAGRHPRYSRRDLEAWIEDQRAGGGVR